MATPTSQLIEASRSLDPAGRALLNLWLHRGLDDAAIAGLSGGAVEDVAARRRAVVERLAAAVGDSPDAVRRAIDDLAAGEPDGRDRPAGRPAAVAVSPRAPEVRTSEPALEGEPRDRHRGPGVRRSSPGAEVSDGEREARRAERERRRAADRAAPASPLPVALGVAVGVIFVAMVLIAALSGGGDEGSAGGAQGPAASGGASARPAATPAAQPLRPVEGGPPGVTGTLALASDGTFRLRLAGLPEPPADYEVWLFNSVTDARSLGRLDRGTFRLPRDASRFDGVDVSREVDAAPAHSGRSVLRTTVPAPSAGR